MILTQIINNQKKQMKITRGGKLGFFGFFFVWDIKKYFIKG